MFAEAELQKWWDRLSDDQRILLKHAAENTKLEPATVKLLEDTRCPVGPLGGSWPESDNPDWEWSWPPDVRDFVRAH